MWCALCRQEIAPEDAYMLSGPVKVITFCSLGCLVSWAEREMMTPQEESA